MLPKKEDYCNQIERLFCTNKNNKHVLTFTFQVTTECSLRCTYCYQINKSHHFLDFATAKQAIDYIFSECYNSTSIFSYDKVQGIIFDFIGGEPLLNIDVVTEIIKYIEYKMIILDSPWLLFHRYSFSTNGVSYFDNKVQNILLQYSDLISMSITIDGNKELHDSCRLFPDGSGSYDIAIKAAIDQLHNYDNDSTKITLCPQNINYLFNATKNMIELGFRHIWANFAYEDGWTLEHARICYQQMIQLADWILDNNLDDKLNIGLFDLSAFSPHSIEDTQNWCGGTGAMVALDWRGDFYPCIRYMETSLGQKNKPLIIGNIKNGIYNTPESKVILENFNKVTWQSQQPDECLKCKISSGCSWCSAFNYQTFGTVNKRATFICIMHKARALGNEYFWLKEANKYNKDLSFNIEIDAHERALITEV